MEAEYFRRESFDSKSLFEGEMKVTVFEDEGATESDAERCIAHYNALVLLHLGRLKRKKRKFLTLFQWYI